jgi:hypothetical protein
MGRPGSGIRDRFGSCYDSFIPQTYLAGME